MDGTNVSESSHGSRRHGYRKVETLEGPLSDQAAQILIFLFPFILVIGTGLICVVFAHLFPGKKDSQ